VELNRYARKVITVASSLSSYWVYPWWKSSLLSGVRMGVLGGIVCVTNQSSDQEQKKLESIRASIKALNLKANDSPPALIDKLY